MIDQILTHLRTHMAPAASAAARPPALAGSAIAPYLQQILDRAQLSVPSCGKTKILPSAEFIAYCQDMIADRPVKDLEENILKFIDKYAKGDPYRFVFIKQLSPADLLASKPSRIEAILAAYLAAPQPDFRRLHWLIRRLAQIGHPAGVH